MTAKTRGSQRAPNDYLQRILTARVYDVAIESPLEPARTLSRRIGNHVLLKREDQQPVFSFKLRGAYNKIAHLTPAQRKRGVICASAGNHAQGVALAGQKLGIRAVIVMPTTTPQIRSTRWRMAPKSAVWRPVRRAYDREEDRCRAADGVLDPSTPGCDRGRAPSA
jgi:threonine dehydratase